MIDLEDLARRARATEPGQIFLDADFALYDAGMGLTAWRLDIIDGWHILITDSEGLSHELGPNYLYDGSKPDAWLIGIHGPRGEYQDELDETTDAATAARIGHLLAAVKHAEIALAEAQQNVAGNADTTANGDSETAYFDALKAVRDAARIPHGEAA